MKIKVIDVGPAAAHNCCNMAKELPRGVSRRKYKRKSSSRIVNYRGTLFYVAQLRIGGKLHRLGFYHTADEAGRAYDEALFLLSDAQVVPWYLRFNSELDFLDSSGEQLRPASEIQFVSAPVTKWWERTFADAKQRDAARQYYRWLNIPLDRQRVTPAPRRSPRYQSPARRGPYAPRLARVLAEQAIQQAAIHDYSI